MDVIYYIKRSLYYYGVLCCAIQPETAITQHFIRKKVISGEIPCVRAGAKRLIAIEDVDDYIETGNSFRNKK